jgi:hypothetical protein
MLVADVATTFGEVRLRVTGLSMLPSIWPGDILTVRRVNPAELAKGRIALYRRQGNLIAHRIARVEPQRLITRGDTLPHDDPPLNVSEIIGQVVGIDRNGRSIPPEPSFWNRAVSSILRRSDFCLRIALCLVRLLSRPADAVRCRQARHCC